MADTDAPMPDPIYVLSMARSGSTLLRLLLDAHPELACPPETGIPALCAQVAVLWSLIEGAPLSATPGSAPPVIPDAAVAGVRSTLDSLIRSYLDRRGKRVFCDKTLGAARYADLLHRTYPEAKFLCLYRHPMDVIMSGIEASPWGLQDYGFGPYAASSPDNMVFALARYWLDHASAIRQVEEQYGHRCHRVRYEDLVQAPEQVVGEVFEFLGVTAAPQVLATCFTAQHERLGPGDYKIWQTSRISTGSVGRGRSIPAALVPGPVLDALNAMLEALGYVQIDASWGTPESPRELRAVDRHGGPLDRRPSAEAAPTVPPYLHPLDERLRTGVARLDARFADRWVPCGQERFDIVAQSEAGDGVRWRIDLASLRVSMVGSTGRWAEAGEDPCAWCVVAAPDVWDAVLSGHLNLGVGLRRGEIRYCVTQDDGALLTDRRIGIVGDLLGVSRWADAPIDGPRPQHAGVGSVS